MGKKKYKGGDFFQGDYGCVVHPSLVENFDVNTTVTKVFKEPAEKAKEETIFNTIISRFPNDFIVKKIDDSVNPEKNPEIQKCKIQSKDILKYIKQNSISYEYLGKTYENIFIKPTIQPDRQLLLDGIKALIDLAFKVIEMNNAGINHNDIADRNVTYKDGRAHLIDIGEFDMKQGRIDYSDVSEIMSLMYTIIIKYKLVTNNDFIDDLILLQGYTSYYSGVRRGNIEQLKVFLPTIMSFFTTTGASRQTRRRSKRRKTRRYRK
jgi:hypothetical protein